MSLLDTFVIFDNANPTPLDHFFAVLGVVFALGGAYLITSALFPQYKWTYKAKNTVGVNIPMFSFHTLVALLFLIGAVLLVIGGAGLDKKVGWSLVASGVVFTLLNIYGFLGNAYVVLLKLSHAGGAKKAGISESEYYEKFVAPKLKK